MAKWTIEPKIRPCIIKNYHQPGYTGDVTAWFHCWVTKDDETNALVELENGECRFVKPKRIQFLDTKRVEDEYDISHKKECSHDCYYPMGECNLCQPEEEKTCENCKYFVAPMDDVSDCVCGYDGCCSITKPDWVCARWMARKTYESKECEIRGE